MEVIIIINMKPKKEEKTWLLEVAGKGSVKASVQIPVEGIADKSPAQEPLIKDDKGERSCLLDSVNGIVHVKERGDSLGMEIF